MLHLSEQVIADLEREQMADRQIGMAHALDRVLKDLDPRLELVWVGERATPAPGVVPARWHVRRRNEGAPDTYIPLVGPDGEYVEPHSGHLELLRRGDLWNRDVLGELRREREQQQARTQRVGAEAAAERVDTAATVIKSRVNPGVSFSDARAWRNRLEPLPGE